MPLVPGYSRKAISANIALLRKEGRDQAQAVAIAFSNARKYAKRISDRKKREAILARLTEKKGR